MYVQQVVLYKTPCSLDDCKLKAGATTIGNDNHSAACGLCTVAK